MEYAEMLMAVAASILTLVTVLVGFWIRVGRVLQVQTQMAADIARLCSELKGLADLVQCHDRQIAVLESRMEAS